MKWIRFLILSCAASISFWLAMYQWWWFVFATPALLGYLFCQSKNRMESILVAVAGGLIVWRVILDSLSAFGQIGVNVLSLWQSPTLIPVALSLRWGMGERLSDALVHAHGLGGRGLSAHTGAYRVSFWITGASCL